MIEQYGAPHATSPDQKTAALPAAQRSRLLLSTRGLIQEERKADIEAKRDWKRANKGKSPDELDAVAVMTEGLLQRKVLSLTQQWTPLPGQTTLPDFMRPKVAAAGQPGRRRRASDLVRGW